MVQEGELSEIAAGTDGRPLRANRDAVPHQDLLVRSQDIDLAVRDYGGDGSPVLLLHGLTQNLAAMTPLAQQLRSRHRVVSADLRGHGHSGDGAFTWKTSVADVQAVASALGMEAPTVVGHSLGGMVAAACATQWPGCRAAVNLDGTGNGSPQMWGERERSQALERAAVIRQMSAVMWPSSPLPAQLVEMVKQERIRAAMEAGMAAEAALEHADRLFQGLDDGTFQIRPSKQAADSIADLIETTDMLDFHAHPAVPLLLVQAKRLPSLDAVPPDQRDLLPPWLSEHLSLAADRAETAFSNLAQKQTLFHHRPVRMTHALVVEQPQAVAALVCDFITQS